MLKVLNKHDKQSNIRTIISSWILFTIKRPPIQSFKDILVNEEFLLVLGKSSIYSHGIK